LSQNATSSVLTKLVLRWCQVEIFLETLQSGSRVVVSVDVVLV
jgi:hypothetical protein